MPGPMSSIWLGRWSFAVLAPGAFRGVTVTGCGVPGWSGARLIAASAKCPGTAAGGRRRLYLVPGCSLPGEDPDFEPGHRVRLDSGVRHSGSERRIAGDLGRWRDYRPEHASPLAGCDRQQRGASEWGSCRSRRGTTGLSRDTLRSLTCKFRTATPAIDHRRERSYYELPGLCRLYVLASADHIVIRDNVLTNCGLGFYNWTGPEPMPGRPAIGIRSFGAITSTTMASQANTTSTPVIRSRIA